MPKSEQDTDFVHNFGFLFVVAHELLVDTFEGYQFTRESVHTETDLSEGTSTKHFTCSVEIRSRFWGITFGKERFPDFVRNENHLPRSWRKGPVAGI